MNPYRANKVSSPVPISRLARVGPIAVYLTALIVLAAVAFRFGF